MIDQILMKLFLHLAVKLKTLQIGKIIISFYITLAYENRLMSDYENGNINNKKLNCLLK